MKFTDTFETPILIEFAGKQYHLEKLKSRDYTIWVSEIQKQYQDRNLPLIEETASNADKIQFKSSILGREFNPDNCAPQVGTQQGAERVVTASFVKTITSKRIDKSRDDEDVKSAIATADQFIETLEWPELLALAIRISGLFFEDYFDELFAVSKRKKDKPKGNGESPNGVGANAPSENSQTGNAAS